MFINKQLLLIFAAMVVLAAPDAQAQIEQVEVGAHFSFLRLNSVKAGPSVTVLDESRDPGIGGRVTVNVNRFLAFEAEGNYYRKDRSQRGDRVLGLFGAKAGLRLPTAGFFLKARPGILYFKDAIDKSTLPVGRCAGISGTNFALDIGGVVEFYPAPFTTLRFDAGNLTTRISAKCPFPTADRVTNNNLMFNVGVGFRF